MVQFYDGRLNTKENDWQRFYLSDLFLESGHTYTLAAGSPNFTKIKYDDRLILYPRDGDDGEYSITVLSSSGRAMSMAVSVKDTINPSVAQSDLQPVTAPEPEPAENSTFNFGLVETKEDGWSRIMLPEQFGATGLSYMLSADAPSFVQIKDGTKLIIFPRDGDDGDYSFTVTASDGENMTVGVSVADNINPGTTQPEPTPVEPAAELAPEPAPLQGMQKSLMAGYLGNRTGEVEWADKVTLTGYDVNGVVAKVWFDNNEFDDDGFGVAGPGSRWDTQIDYYEWGEAGPRSERLVIDFNGSVEDVFIFTGMMSGVEGPDDLNETGRWRAYDDGILVAKGLLGPETKKIQGSYGSYKFAIGDSPIDRIEIEATQMDHGSSDSFNRPYGENSSDFGIMGVDYLRLDYDF